MDAFSYVSGRPLAGLGATNCQPLGRKSEIMKTSKKLAIWFFIIHSIIPIFVFSRLLSISDGTERWANTLVLYIIDIFLYPLFAFIQNSTHIGDSSFINTSISFFLGGLIYSLLGFFIGHKFFNKQNN
jgi:hypothetical protein